MENTLPQSVVASILDKWGTDPELAAAGLELGLEQPEVNDVINGSEVNDSEGQEAPEEPTSVAHAEVVEAAGEVDEGEEDAPPVPPGGPIFDLPEDPALTLPDGRTIPASVVAGWLDAPPVRPAPQPVQPVVESPPSPALPPLPQLSEEDLESPAVRALLLIANSHQNQIKQLESRVVETRSQVEARQTRENTELANAAATQFQREYNLPDEIMNKIRSNVQASDMEHFLTNVKPDPYKAVEHGLSRAYWNTAEARAFEFERQANARTQARTRKQKLAGVSGNSGSGPRAEEPQYDLSTPEGNRAAAVAEVAQAMGLNEG